MACSSHLSELRIATGSHVGILSREAGTGAVVRRAPSVTLPPAPDISTVWSACDRAYHLRTLGGVPSG